MVDSSEESRLASGAEDGILGSLAGVGVMDPRPLGSGPLASVFKASLT